MFWEVCMTIKIGNIIKSLRAERGVTQEMLASALAITPQAVSRWESGATYPDIELLPILADYFSVSIDVLLGYRLCEREENLLQIKKEAERLAEDGTVEERIAYMREALISYPFDDDLKLHLATALYHKWCTDDKSFSPCEIEALCLSIMETTKDADIKFFAVLTLCSLYGESNCPEKAMALINTHLAPMKYCREFVLSGGIGDGNTERYIQDELDKLTDGLGIAIQSLALHEDLPNDPSTWDKKIEMLNISNRLYLMIYGDDLMSYHCRLSQNHWLISTYQMAQGKDEEALASLEKMAHHALAYDKAKENDHGKCYTSVLTDKLIYPYPSKEFHEVTAHNDAFYHLKRLGNKRYDPIREHPRFVAIAEALKETAK